MVPAATESTTREVEGHCLTFTNPDKVMYPEAGLTKQGVIDYYTSAADVLLPQLRDRVVTRIRYVDGIGGERFYEKNTPSYMPDWIRRFDVSASPGTGKKAKTVRYPVIDDVAGLLWMANQAALELHTPQWRIGPRGGVRNPDRLVMDLDPGEGMGLDDVAEIAHVLRGRLEDDGLEPIPVTSGSKGIHLYAAVDVKRTALKVHAYVKDVAREMAEKDPERMIAVIGKAERAGKVMIDWSQNHPARSTATPYTLRGKPEPTVAAPRLWEEIGPGVTQVSADEALSRLGEMGDLMAEAGLV